MDACRTPPASPSSQGFVRRFLERHLDIQKKTAHPLELQRMVACKRDNIQSYFAKIEELVTAHHYHPSLIFNFDETMIENGPRCARVLVPTSSRKPSFPYDEQILHITLCLCIIADGTFLKPLIILPNKEFPPDLQDFSNAFCWSGADSGWMNRDILRQYMSKVFIPGVIAKRSQLQTEIGDIDSIPRCLLVVDGHSSRECPEMLVQLSEACVDVVCIPSHTSHILQPLDCGVNRKFKGAMKSRRSMNGISSVSQRRTAIITSAKWATHSCLFEETIKKSFSTAGLYPFDPSMVLDAGRITPDTFAVPPKQTRKRSHISISNRVLTQPEFIEELTASQAARNIDDSVDDKNPAPSTVSPDIIEEPQSNSKALRTIQFDDTASVESLSIDEEVVVPECPKIMGQYDFRIRTKPRITQLMSRNVE